MSFRFVLTGMMEQDLDDPQIPMLYAQYLLSKSMEVELCTCTGTGC